MGNCFSKKESKPIPQSTPQASSPADKPASMDAIKAKMKAKAEELAGKAIGKLNEAVPGINIPNEFAGDTNNNANSAAPTGAAPGVVRVTLSDEDILFFEKFGYIHLPGVVPMHEVNAALGVIDSAYATGNHGHSKANPTDIVPSFGDDVAKNPAVFAPLKDTPLFGMIEQLIGKDSCWQPQRAQVALREPSEYWKGCGWDTTTPLNPDGWHIDGGAGKYAHVGSAFTLLVGVCLSTGQDCDGNHGQFLVWPGSHHVLHPAVKDRVDKGLIKDPHSIFAGTREQRPNIGAPIRVQMKPGDAVLAHQRTGHSGGPNLGPHIRKNLYLRVMNKNHDKYLSSGELLNGSVWTEYAGVRATLQKYGRPV